MNLFDTTGEEFGEGNVALLMVLGMISYGERLNAARATAIAQRPGRGTAPARRKVAGAARSIDRLHAVDLAVLGIDSFARSVAGMVGPQPAPRRRRAARARSAPRRSARVLRQVLR